MFKSLPKGLPKCDHFRCDKQFCIECDKETCFVDWICTECGCHSPEGDFHDPELSEETK